MDKIKLRKGCLSLLFALAIFIAIEAAGCNARDKILTSEQQYELASNRTNGMRGILELGVKLKDDKIKFSNSIVVTAYFNNLSTTPVTFRVPQPTGVLDIKSPNTSLFYEIETLGSDTYIQTPLSALVTPYIFSDPVLSNQFEVIDSNSTYMVEFEIPNWVYIKNDEEWIGSNIPPGRYLLSIVYYNMYVGYQFTEDNNIYYHDLNAWVGETNRDEVLLEIIP